MRAKTTLLLATAAAMSLSAAAAYADPVKVSVDGEATGVAGVARNDARVLADARARLKASTILRNGIEVGTAVEGRANSQQAPQFYAGGRYSSLLIGGPRGVTSPASDIYLQSAYAYTRGAFGTVIVGRDQGVARTFAVTAPTLFRATNVNDWRIDLTGLNDVHTVNDLTGYSTKVSYLPPANLFGGVLGGLQLGVSYSPTLRACGDRLCAPEQGFILSPTGELLTESTRWTDAVEGALYYQKNFGKGRDAVLLGLGASVVKADADVGNVSLLVSDYRAYSVGLNVGYRGVTLGGSVKTTNAGLASSLTPNSDNGYLAFDAGVTYKSGDKRGDWGLMLGYGQSQAVASGPNPASPVLYRDTHTAQAGVSFVLRRGFTVGAAAQYVESKKPDTVSGPKEAGSVVLETSIKF